MKKEIGQIVAKIALNSARVACNSTSFIGLYQPKTPKQLCKADRNTIRE